MYLRARVTAGRETVADGADGEQGADGREGFQPRNGHELRECRQVPVRAEVFVAMICAAGRGTNIHRTAKPSTAKTKLVIQSTSNAPGSWFRTRNATIGPNSAPPASSPR